MFVGVPPPRHEDHADMDDYGNSNGVSAVGMSKLGNNESHYIAWIPNRQRHLLKNNWRRANNMLIADLNDNNRPNIIAAAEHMSRDVW
ncbi:MAG: hypothetical protein MK110_07315 [Fuerstiella sp.]|nr:hypothetical protein [Fuerstiella sp.]